MRFFRSDEQKGLLYIVIASILWSTGGIGIKALVDSPLKVAMYRSAVAAVALLIIFRPRAFRATPMFFFSIFSYAACLTTFVIATKWTTAANAIFLQYTAVIWIMLLSPVFLREAMKRKDVIAIVVALGGMALFFVHNLELRGMRGNLVAVLSSFFYTALVLSLRRQRGAVAEAAVTYGNVLVAVALLPFVASDLHLTSRSVGILLFLGIFQIAFAYAFFVRGLKYVNATEASLTGMLEPIANPVWVFLFLGERPSIYALLGGAIVLGSIAWRTLTVGPPPQEEVGVVD